jgi:glycosyltransferase involved in cell wall biosynthesis
MKSILIVTPYFAPQSHAAVFRAHKLAKYLPKHGWKPYVLTVDTNYLYNEDPDLLDELPDEVEIIRTRYIEPSARGFTMALGGRDRTFIAEKAGLLERQRESGAESPAPASPRTSPPPRVLAGKLYAHARRTWLQSPDAYWTWERTAIRSGRELIDRHGIDVVYTTAMPFTSHRIGMALQREGARWTADFRDPVTYAAKVSASSGRIHNRQYGIVRDTLRNADAVTVLSSSYGLVFQDIYGDVTKRPVRFIPTGVDDEFIPNDVEIVTEEPYLIYAGEVMPEQTDDFFTMLGCALRRVPAPYRLKVVGHEILNRQRLDPIVAAEGIADRVDFIDHVPQRELYRLIQGATAGILVPGRMAYWWNNHAKLVDYVGLRKPVLAMVPDPSEARSELTKTGLGVFLDGEVEQATEMLTAFLNGTLSLPEPVADECDRYLATSQVASFADVFDCLV